MSRLAPAGPTLPHGQRRFASSFAAFADLAPLRARVADLLVPLGRSRAHVRAVALIVSELATNALLHGSPPHRVAVDVDPTETVVEVSDANLADVEAREPAESAGGYGLHLIDALASDWDTRTEGNVKLVRAAIPRARGL